MKNIVIIFVFVFYVLIGNAQNSHDHRKYVVPDVITNEEIHYYANLCFFHYSDNFNGEYVTITAWNDYDFLFRYVESENMWRKIKIENDSIYEISDLIDQSDSSKYCNDFSLKIKCQTKENLFKVFIYCPLTDMLKEEDR